MGGQVIQLIRDEELDLGASRPELADLVAQLLGDGDKELSASDSELSAAILGFADGAAGVAAADPLFVESVALAEVVTEDTLAADTVQLQQDLANGQQVLTDIDALFGTPPPATTPPTPPGGGGGGGGGVGRGEGGGGGPSGCGPANQVDVYLDGTFIGTVCTL
jgi:hypothetical protein